MKTSPKIVMTFSVRIIGLKFLLIKAEKAAGLIDMP